MHCLVGITLLSYYPFPSPSQRLCALVGAWEQKALSDSLPASQTGVKVRVTFRSSASSSMHQSSGERRQRLACHTTLRRLRVTLAGRAGTLVKARGAADCEKGTNGVFYSPSHPSLWDSQGPEQTGAGQVQGQRWRSWNVCLLLYQVLFLPPPGGEIISCQNRSQITGNCSSPNYLVLIGD